MSDSQTTKSYEQRLYDCGFADGRDAEREHCNNVLQQFFKTFKFHPKPTIEDAEAHNANN